MRLRHLLLLLLAALAFGACEKDTETLTTTTLGTVAGELAPITASVYGRLTDVNGEPIEGARVTAGTATTITDQEGLYRLDEARVGATFGYVTFEHPSYLHGSRTVYAQAGGTYRVDVELLSRTQTYPVSAADGGTVTLAGSEASVAFGPGAFAKTDGTPLTSGEVTVLAHYLDAADEATYRRMPGDLRALATGATSTTDFTLLTTFGMLAVELTDASGREVVLADGQTATLTMPQSAEALADAPATIPLWYFDEAAGIWREEGAATLEGDAYVGEVSHFTWWNCDIPTEYVTLCATFLFDSPAGDTTSTTPLQVAVASGSWGTAYGYTDADGRLCGIVPANDRITLTVYGYGDCAQAIYTQQVGPLTEDTDLGTTNITAQAASVVALSGSASCNGAPVTRGAVRLFQNGGQLDVAPIDPSGAFSLTTVSCDSSELTVVVVDYNALAESDPIVFPFGNDLQTGDVEACQQALTSYFQLTVNGNTFVGDSVTFSQVGDFYIFDGDGVDMNEGFHFSGALNTLPVPLTLGSFTVDTRRANNNRNSLGVSGTPFNSSAWIFIRNSTVPVEVTAVPNGTNEYVEVTLGPVQETVLDSATNLTTTYDIEIQFSTRPF